MTALVDTNVLVYRHDPRDPGKQARARALLRQGIEDGSLRVPHQAIVEFVAAVSRPLPGLGPLLSPADARREAEEMLRTFMVLYPDAHLVRVALQGMAAYELSWWDAHMWAYAEVHGLDTLFSEDYQHGRWYGGVQVVNPFATGVLRAEEGNVRSVENGPS
ncbi:MAG TPA: PIN domain-containing protein [Longimicrobiales bacterium]|nr:PIN domain-containing protein [Longimicrobiales bacterium]